MEGGVSCEGIRMQAHTRIWRASAATLAAAAAARDWLVYWTQRPQPAGWWCWVMMLRGAHSRSRPQGLFYASARAPLTAPPHACVVRGNSQMRAFACTIGILILHLFWCLPVCC